MSVAIVILLTLAVRVPLLSIPFERDEGEYAYIAWRLGYHELPYRDWVDQKPPGIFWAYRLALCLPFEPIRAVHVMAMLFSAASACALFFLARRFMGHLWAGMAAAVFAVLSADPLVEGTAANTEIFMLLPLILSQAAFLSAVREGRRRLLFTMLSGAFCGVAVAFKQVAVVHWPFLVALCPVFVGPEKRLRQTLSFAAWSAAGAVAVWIPILSYFFLQHGLGDFAYNVLTHNLEYINAIPWSVRLSNCVQTLSTLSRTQALIWIFAVAGFVAALRTGRVKLLLFLAGWMAASLVGVSASGYFFPHYFQQLLPALAVTAALGAESLGGLRFREKLPAWTRRAGLGIAFVVLPAITLYPFIFTYTPAEAVGRIYPHNFFAEMPGLAKRLVQVTRPDERVFIFGAESEVLFYARRVSATRYIFLFPLYGPYRNARERQIAAAEETSASQPAAALYLPNSLFFAPGTEQYFTRWTQSYLREHFRPDTYLALDEHGSAYLTPAIGGPLPDGHRIIGWLIVRNAE